MKMLLSLVMAVISLSSPTLFASDEGCSANAKPWETCKIPTALEEGQRFPDFALPDQNNKITKLKDFSGKWLVLYVYPKDDTPGCTIQGKGFTSTRQEFEANNAVVVGINQDDVKSHKKFCNKYGLTISLLSDTEAKLLSAMGVGQKELNGAKYWNRSTFVVDPKGYVRKIYKDVLPQGHEKMVLEDIKSLQKEYKG